LEKAKEVVKKIKPDDFLNENISEIFSGLKKYLKDRKSEINIKSLSKKFDGDTKDLLSELYLWDFDRGSEASDQESEIEKELDEIVDRLIKDSVKRQLQILSDEIKIAETKKDESELEKLMKKFDKLSKSLL